MQAPSEHVGLPTPIHVLPQPPQCDAFVWRSAQTFPILGYGAVQTVRSLGHETHWPVWHVWLTHWTTSAHAACLWTKSPSIALSSFQGGIAAHRTSPTQQAPGSPSEPRRRLDSLGCCTPHSDQHRCCSHNTTHCKTSAHPIHNNTSRPSSRRPRGGKSHSIHRNALCWIARRHIRSRRWGFRCR